MTPHRARRKRRTIMSEPMTKAELWDRRIERVEWLVESAEHDLGEVIDFEKAFDLWSKLRTEVLEDAVRVEWSSPADRDLTFSDGSMLLLIAGDAHTAAGGSRVLRPADRERGRMQVRDGGTYQHGTNQKAWLAFPPHDSF